MIEGASDASLLRTESVRERFFDTMIQGGAINAAVRALIAEEAAVAGEAPLAEAFAASIVYRGKGGNYGRNGRTVNAEFGRILLPFKAGGQVQQRAFAFGHFYNCEVCSDAAQTIDPAFRVASTEKFRPAIRRRSPPGDRR